MHIIYICLHKILVVYALYIMNSCLFLEQLIFKLNGFSPILPNQKIKNELIQGKSLFLKYFNIHDNI